MQHIKVLVAHAYCLINVPFLFSYLSDFSITMIFNTIKKHMIFFFNLQFYLTFMKFLIFNMYYLMYVLFLKISLIAYYFINSFRCRVINLLEYTQFSSSELVGAERDYYRVELKQNLKKM